MPPPSPLTAEQQKATLVSGSKLFGMSLSHALANADQGLITTGNIRVGAETEPLFGGDKTSANVPLKSVPTEPSVPITPQTAKPAADALDKVVPNLTPSPQSKITSAPPSVIDLSRRQPLDITAITTPEQLSQIGLFDADGVYFSEKLSQLKQRIVKLADEYQLPISRVAEYFYRSPLYQLFINMGVAVMNDNTAPDQKTAFEKVAANYKAARKETLSYEQFLAFSQFKKEISELEARI
jgi:hypothetical protein